MTCEVSAGQSEPQAHLDDQMTALGLQLEEIDLRSENSKGKDPADRPPDVELAFSAFQNEVQSHISFLTDLGLARSVAQAVSADGQAIAELTHGEAQAQRDRQLAFQVDGSGNPETDDPPPYSQVDLSVSASEESFVLVTDVDDHEEDAAGPSTAYASLQERAMAILAQKNTECSVCWGAFRQFDVFHLQCGDVYCKDCLKDLFMRATVDETLFPPRCCREQIPLSLIAGAMTAEELSNFKSSEIEFSTTDRVYCSSVDCGRFIPPNQITAGRAECGHCGYLTCSMCKNEFHYDDCPDDPALQEALALAREEGWQRCYRCRALVQLHTGCFHITCNCKAQFCYLCGVRWKNCTCDHWREENLVDRAEEIVDREAAAPLLHPERQRRVVQMRDELLETHECEHSRRFERITFQARRGFTCEMCEGRLWKFILQCRRCHLRVCQDCRMHRI